MEGYVIQSRYILGTFSYRHNLLSYGFDSISNSFQNKKWGAIHGPQQAEEDSSNYTFCCKVAKQQNFSTRYGHVKYTFVKYVARY